MLFRDGYNIELDYFSGRENPSFAISEEEFLAVFERVLRLEKSRSTLLFDGLGFRGIVLSGPGSRRMTIQKKIIEVREAGMATYFQSQRNIISLSIDLFKDNDRENKYRELVENAVKEYLSD